jgi:acyl-coenzyme A thioesterase PaaI-like protein
MPRTAGDNRIVRAWERARRLPLGRRALDRLIGFSAPFTGVLRPHLLELEPGRSRLQVKDRRRLHQHLGSMHAGAMFTFVESASGLAMAASIPDDCRAIVTGGGIEFFKKARGVLVAEARLEIPDPDVEATHEVAVAVTDEAGDTVARATISWLVGRKSKG